MTPPAFSVAVRGTPAPQGSKRHVGKGVMLESSKKVAPWRDAVRTEAAVARELYGDFAPFDGPLWVDMVFTVNRPAAHYRTGRNAHILRDNAPTRPARTPDLSKLARSTEDALTDAGVWADDARVVEYHRLAKVFAREDRDALDSPGVIVRVYTEEPADG